MHHNEVYFSFEMYNAIVDGKRELMTRVRDCLDGPEDDNPGCNKNPAENFILNHTPKYDLQPMPNVPYTVKIACENNKLNAFVNGQLMHSAEIQRPEVKFNRVHLWTDRTDVKRLTFARSELKKV